METLRQSAADPLIYIVTMLAMSVAFIYASRPRLARPLLLVATFGLYLLATPMVSERLQWSLMRDARLPSASAAADKPQVILVLTADARYDPDAAAGLTAGPVALERIQRAAVLHRSTGLPVVISGGSATAQAMKNSLESAFLVPVKWVENASRNTSESAALAGSFLRGQGIDSVFLVTHSLHMKRAAHLFRRQNLIVVSSPVSELKEPKGFGATDLLPCSCSLARSYLALHEWVGIWWYELQSFRASSDK